MPERDISILLQLVDFIPHRVYTRGDLVEEANIEVVYEI